MSNPWKLPPRQVEVLTLLTGHGNGCNKIIARAMGIDPRTVEEHMRRALKKMGATNRVQAAIMWDRWDRTQ
jgi:DNA-binding NarL/FixJ family response regulator